MGWNRLAFLAVLAYVVSVSHVRSQSTTSVAEVLPKIGGSRPAKFVVIPGCVTSHWYQALAVIQELSKRGHKVQVVLSSEYADAWQLRLSELPHVNVVSYNTTSYGEMEIRQQIRATQRAVGLSGLRDIFGLPKHSEPLLQDTDLHQKIQQFGADLALVDVVLAGGTALADILGIPKAILYITGALPPVVGHAYGSGIPLLATVPQWQTALPRNMTFLQRVQNLLGYLMNMGVWCYVIEPLMDQSVWQKYAIPPYSYAKSNRQVALVLLHSDWAITNAEPLAPHIVSVGALTAAPAKALPSDLEDFVQSGGEHGVVYASLGTTAIPEIAELRAIAQGLCAIAPAKALWKLADTDLVMLNSSSLPVCSNIKVVKWAPQNDVLGHPSVKAFYTQGGANSFNEASYHGVPIVGMAMIGEQPDNLARAVDRGYGLTVSVKRLGTLAQDLEQALKRLLGEPSFKTNAERISHMMRAHRLTPAEKAADALEHAAWTQGSRHMQPLRDDLNWFQHSSLDVILFVGAVLAAVISVVAVTIIGLGRRMIRWLATAAQTDQTHQHEA
ncbi:UDP-glycosyltransferase [Trebouxia sp. C0009 RCD-2024]